MSDALTDAELRRGIDLVLTATGPKPPHDLADLLEAPRAQFDRVVRALIACGRVKEFAGILRIRKGVV